MPNPPSRSRSAARLAVWLAELTRHRERLRAARARFAVVQLFGAAGTAAALGPQSRSSPSRPRREAGTRGGRRALARRTRFRGRGGARARGDCRHLRQARQGGDRALPPGARRGARSGRPPARRLVDDAPEGEPDRQRGRGRPQHPRRRSRAAPCSQRCRGRTSAPRASGRRSGTRCHWLFAATAGALAGTHRLVRDLQVFPERMRENLEGEGGLIMAEAAMIALAGVVGRAAAHALVAESSSVARAERISLREALERDARRRDAGRAAASGRGARLSTATWGSRTRS